MNCILFLLTLVYERIIVDQFIEKQTGIIIQIYKCIHENYAPLNIKNKIFYLKFVFEPVFIRQVLFIFLGNDLHNVTVCKDKVFPPYQ